MENKIIYWTTKDGQKIDIMSMDVNHLRNVLKMIVNNSNKHKKKQEFKLNGDMAQEFNNSFDDYSLLIPEY